jgi:transposase
VLWKRRQGGIDPSRLVFIDESAAKTNMTRLRGRCLRGQRLRCSAPHGHWRTTTVIGAVRVDGTTATMVIEGATDTEVFRAYVKDVLVPTLRPGDVVVMDNLIPHKSEPTLALIQAAGAQALFLPPYSPDLNPIELMWSKVKASLRAAEARTYDDLLLALAAALNSISDIDARNWFAHCGYNFI